MVFWSTYQLDQLLPNRYTCIFITRQTHFSLHQPAILDAPCSAKLQPFSGQLSHLRTRKPTLAGTCADGVLQQKRRVFNTEESAYANHPPIRTRARRYHLPRAF